MAFPVSMFHLSICQDELISFFYFIFSLQITEQVQNLTVSSTTNSTSNNNNSNSRTPTSESNYSTASSSLTSILKETAAANSGKENLAQRLKFLQNQLAHAPMPSITSKRRQLPSIEEAWNLPISAEMSSRQQQTTQNQQQRAFSKNYNQVSAVMFPKSKGTKNTFNIFRATIISREIPER